MPSIYLGKQSGMYYTDYAVVTVSEQPYPSSNLFQKYRHKPLSYFTPGYIYLYKTSFPLFTYATLQPGSDYYDASLQYADVYFNRFDTNNTPLVCFLKFNTRNKDPRVKDRIYTNSDHGTLIDRKTNAIMTALTEFDAGNEKGLLELLLEENLKSLNSITYQLDKTNTGNAQIDYNSDKITLSTKQTIRADYQNDFHKYNHKPKNRIKKSFFMYMNNAPMYDNTNFVPNVQGEQYDNVTVFYSNKLNTPLFIELVNNGKKIHLQRLNTQESKWTRNDIQYTREETLINYLRAIFRFVKEKKEEEQRRELEKRRIEQEQGRDQESQPEPETEQVTESTGEQGPAISPTSSRGVGTVRSRSQSPKPSLNGKVCVLIDKQKVYEKSDLDTLFQTSKSQIKVPEEQPSIYLLSDNLKGTEYLIYTHHIKPDLSKLQATENRKQKQDIVIELKIYISSIDISIFDKNRRVTKLNYNISISENSLYVYFYEHKSKPPTPDSVPLMLQHNGKFYGPSKRDEYFTGWRLIDGINGISDTTNIKNNLDTINKELNKIELTNKGGDKCSYGIPELPSVEIKEFKTERIQVKVEQINSTTSKPLTSSSGDSCASPLICPKGPYVKYTHTTINKFKLGDIYYKSKEVKVIEQNQDKTSPGKPISIGENQNLVSVYYWINDTKHTYPLLIGIGKQKESGGTNVQGEIDDYYKLVDTTTVNYKWQKLGGQETSGLPGTDTTKLVKLLDKINYDIKKVIKILIDQQKEYELNLSFEAGKGEKYTKESATKIQVQENTDEGCPKLKSSGYVCYEHKVSEIKENGQFQYNKIGGIKFFISGKDNDVEIQLQGEDEKKMEHIPYNNCMGDVFVYFYCKKGEKADPVPLMLRYNGRYYRPEDIDQYFNKWAYQPAFEKLKTPCGSEKEGGDDSYDLLSAMLDVTNKELNRVYLTNYRDYGIPTNKSPPSKELNIDLTRINVTIIPSKTEPSKPYVKLVHRTTNGFGFKEIWYRDRELVASNGINLNGTGDEPTIKIDTNSGGRNNHTVFLNNNNNNPNTVIAYYSTSDSGFKLPQIILLMTTEKPIGQGQEPITSFSNTEYGYYVLSTVKDNAGYKYEWRRPTEEQFTKTQLKLDEKTEFDLLNSIVILMDKQSYYEESAIKAAVQSSGIKSSGNESGVNRLTGKNINSTDYTATGCNYAQKYGYKLYTHDITTLVTWNGSTGHPSIPLIGGLRFLISSSDEADSYKEIKLYSDEAATGSVDRLYHMPTAKPENTKNKVYVFFYGSDPRPLLLCYNGHAYKPKKQRDPIPERQVIMEYSEWTRVTNITECTCMGSGLSQNDDNILNILLEVVCFLNPVQLNPKEIPTTASTTITSDPPKPPLPTSSEYNLHEYKYNSHVKMKITREDVKCYEKYTYEPAGTGGGKNGNWFRLGSVHYSHSNFSSKFNKLDYNTPTSHYKHHPLVKVTVYYYDHDKDYKDPLLIELEFNTNGGIVPSANSKEYYMLKSLITSEGTGMTWAKDLDAVGKFTGDHDNQKLFNHLDTIRYLFKKVLEVRIAIKNTESYKAKMFNTKGTPVTPEYTIDVPVSEEKDCPSLTGTGFRCFKHGISSLKSPDLHKIGGLQFYIPDQHGNQVKLNLYELPRSAPIQPLYYNCGMGDICVYFYGGNDDSGASQIVGDPRPLLLCYNNKAYKAWNINTYDSQIWRKSTEIRECVCKSVGTELLKALVKVCNFLNPVYINKAVKGVYRVHKFNGQQITINLEPKPSDGKFCYHKYVHKPNEGYRLGTIEHSGNCIKEFNEHQLNGDQTIGTCITSVLDKPDKKYTPASEVVVYYYKGDKMYKNPLLVSLCKKANGDTLNGVGSATSNCKCQPYYELQRSSIMTTKTYKKSDNTIKLEERPGTDLEKALDKILYYISKSLLIDLGFKSRIEVKYPGERGKQIPTVKHNTYQAKVYQNESPTKFEKSGKNIDLKVCGPTDIINDKKQKTGYQCYQHKLSSIKDNEQIGGLRLFLWDTRGKGEEDKEDCKVTGHTTQNNHLIKRPCCEIELHDQSSTKITPIAYTTCKGDLYVYFYGSDPRPLLLCYNGQAYKPSDLNTYITVFR